MYVLKLHQIDSNRKVEQAAAGPDKFDLATAGLDKVE